MKTKELTIPSPMGEMLCMSFVRTERSNLCPPLLGPAAVGVGLCGGAEVYVTGLLRQTYFSNNCSILLIFSLICCEQVFS
jgi:hypothetical protein